MNDTQIAWTRTTVNSLWLGLLIWLNARYDWGIDFESAWSILLVGLSAGIVWRVSELLTKIPYVGYVLFGINKEPSYSPLPPPVGEPVPRDAGLTFIETILLVVIVVLAIFGIIYLF